MGGEGKGWEGGDGEAATPWMVGESWKNPLDGAQGALGLSFLPLLPQLPPVFPPFLPGWASPGSSISGGRSWDGGIPSCVEFSAPGWWSWGRTWSRGVRFHRDPAGIRCPGWDVGAGQHHSRECPALGCPGMQLVWNLGADTQAWEAIPGYQGC